MNDLDFDNVLLDAKSYETILICDVIHKFPFARNSLCVIFNKVDRFILKYTKI